MSDLYFLSYNNYYNRIVRFEDTLEAYYSFCLPADPQTSDNNFISCNFNPGNSISATHILNWNNKVFPDYMLVVENGKIISRWFVMDKSRTRGGQYRIILRRDIVVDNLAAILTAPMFIEKAPLQSSDPMIFNSEEMTFNQIKTSETILKDETGCAWIVGYLASVDAENQPLAYNIEYSSSITEDIRVQNLASWDYNKYRNSTFLGQFKQGAGSNYYAINFIRLEGGNSVSGYNYSTNQTRFGDSGFFRNYFKSYGQQNGYPNPRTSLTFDDSITDEQMKSVAEDISLNLTKYFDFHTPQQISEFLNLDGKIIYSIDEDKFYRISIGTPTNYSGSYQITSSSQPILFNAFNAPFNGKGNDQSFEIGYNTLQYQMTLSEAKGATNSLSISTNRYHLRQAPYDMFCIPFSDNLQIKENGVVKCTASKDVAFNVAMAMARKYSSESSRFLYDLQLLPYCPARYCIQPDNSFDIMSNTKGIAYVKDENDNNVGAVIFCTDDSFTFNILLDDPIKITDTKIQSECDMYRLCSPNYNGVFEFNAAKNGGVEFFNVDVTYKPYNPYIHMNPDFGKLYGRDFDDSRGLIVGGDFSLPQTTSAWESYQLTTKNYQASFDRQITNMEINNAIQYQKELASFAANTITAGVTGAGAGGLFGGGIGAILGGAAAATASAVAGAVDLAQNQRLRQETIDYTKDQFGYALGNIKALPTGLSKTSAFTANNKIFPFLEYYTCTDEEKEALRDKIKYNGMTVMRIGTISEFLLDGREPGQSYIKGKIIRLDGLGLEYEEVLEIANELNKGVFI